MEEKINGSIYHKFINNYQRPILITKKDSKNFKKESTNNKNIIDSIRSKIIYVNKKASQNNQNQTDLYSEAKTPTTSSERILTFHNPQKQEKNGIKSLLNDTIKLNSVCNGLPINQKFKRKAYQSVNNELNKLDNKSSYDDNNIKLHNNFLKNEIIKNKNNEYLSNTIQRLKKIQTNINNFNTNGNYDSNKLISSYAGNRNEPKRKKNYSLNYNNDLNTISTVKRDKSKDKNDTIQYDYHVNSNKINDRKKKFLKENDIPNNNIELSKLIQENFNFNFHRKFNNKDFTKNNSMITPNQNLITQNSRINNSIDFDCNYTEDYRRENDNLKDEIYQAYKTVDDDEKVQNSKKNSINQNNRSRYLILNNSSQKKEIKDLQQKINLYEKKLRAMESIQKSNIELEKQNAELRRKMEIVKKKNEIFILQI